MGKSLKAYAADIKKALTKEDLHAISYSALRNDEECTAFSKKYDSIIDMCIKREAELGLC